MSADALQVLHTGAAAAGTGQAAPRECLGGYRASHRATSLDALRLEPIDGLRIDYVSGANGTGLAQLRAVSADSIAWTAPNGTEGAVVSISNGSQVEVADNDADAYAIVTRTSASDLAGSETVQLVDTFNRAVGGTDWTNAESTGGEVDYVALALYNAGASNITSVTVWIDSAADGPSGTATESPSSGQIQTIADRTTAPTGLSWNTATAEGSGLSVGTIASGGWAALWLRRTVTAGADAAANQLNHVHISYTYDGSDYEAELRGRHRTIKDASAGYELFAGQDDYADLTGTADATGSLPLITALAAGHDYYLQTIARNKYGLASLWADTEIITVAGDASETAQPPSGPEAVTLTPSSDGGVIVEALYLPTPDLTDNGGPGRAEDWLVYYTTDNSAPDPSTDTPSVVDMDGAGFGEERLYTTVAAAQLENGPIKVLVRTRRVDDGPTNVDSNNSSASSTTAEHWGPVRPAGLVSQEELRSLYGGVATAPSGTVEESASPSVEWEWQTDGSVTLSVGGSEVWRLYYDSSSAAFRGLSTGYAIGIGNGYGSGSEDGLEVIDANTLYIVVNGTRRMKIDVENEVLYADHWDFASAPSATRADEPVWAMWAATALQAWDASQQQYATPLSVESDGGVQSAVTLELT
jgi:hypothetical protein